MTKTEVKLAIELLKNNKIIILPTDTIYGLSGSVSKENQIKINNIKGSPKEKPLIVLISSLKQLPVEVFRDKKLLNILKLKKPTTVIIPMIDSSESIAIRLVKSNPIKKIISKVGPIFSTSANKSKIKYKEGEVIFNNISPAVERVFYAGNLENEPSTIINFSDMSKKR
ncbi:L-threonylcarbamoyladenylate synthase [Spiroplasma endosymbiont of Panorpa germanica]|uniref:L-threonylcarbamoyladenylate synthase n=1 Tax=Spiroplasma endosymbiont of Panorpa germanica TaxID=3066314 RepID=UPI0030CE3EBC